MVATVTDVASAQSTSKKVGAVQKPDAKANTNLKNVQQTQQNNHELVSGCRKPIKMDKMPGWFGPSHYAKIIVLRTFILPFVKLVTAGV